MFKCEVCKTLRESLDYERKRSESLTLQVEELQKKLLLLADAKTFRALSPNQVVDKNEYFGTSENDEFDYYDEDGDKHILTRKQIDEIQKTTNG